MWLRLCVYTQMTIKRQLPVLFCKRQSLKWSLWLGHSKKAGLAGQQAPNLSLPPLPRSQAGITSGCLNFLKLKFWGSYSSPHAEKRVFHLLSQLHSLIVLHLSVLSMFIQVKVFAAAFHSHKHAGQGCAWSN